MKTDQKSINLDVRRQFALNVQTYVRPCGSGTSRRYGALRAENKPMVHLLLRPEGEDAEVKGGFKRKSVAAERRSMAIGDPRAEHTEWRGGGDI